MLYYVITARMHAKQGDHPKPPCQKANNEKVDGQAVGWKREEKIYIYEKTIKSKPKRYHAE